MDGSIGLSVCHFNNMKHLFKDDMFSNLAFSLQTRTLSFQNTSLKIVKAPRHSRASTVYCKLCPQVISSSHIQENFFFKVLHFINCFLLSCIKRDNPFLSLNVKLTKSMVILPKCHHKYFFGVTNLF